MPDTTKWDISPEILKLLFKQSYIKVNIFLIAVYQFVYSFTQKIIQAKREKKFKSDYPIYFKYKITWVSVT